MSTPEPIDRNLYRLLAADGPEIQLPAELEARMRDAVDRGFFLRRRARVRRRITIAACVAALVFGAFGLQPGGNGFRTGRFEVEAGESIRLERGVVMSAVAPTVLDYEDPLGEPVLQMPRGSALFDVRPSSSPFRVRTPNCDVKGASARFVLRCDGVRAASPGVPEEKGHTLAIVFEGTLQLEFDGGFKLVLTGGDVVATSGDGTPAKMSLGDVPCLREQGSFEIGTNSEIRARIEALEAEVRATHRHIPGFPRLPSLRPPGAEQFPLPERSEDVDWPRAARAMIAIAQSTESPCCDDAHADILATRRALVAVRPTLCDPGPPGDELFHPDVLSYLAVAVLRELVPNLSDEDADRARREARETAALFWERRRTPAAPLARLRDDLAEDEEFREFVARYAPDDADTARELPRLAAGARADAARIIEISNWRMLAETFYTWWRAACVEFDPDQEPRIHVLASRAADQISDLFIAAYEEMSPDSLEWFYDSLKPREASAPPKDRNPADVAARRRLWREIVEAEAAQESLLLSMLHPEQRARYGGTRASVIVPLLKP